MNSAVMGDMVHNAVLSAFTVYMLCILLRWLGPWIELDFHRGWLRAVPRATDPLIRGVRQAMGRWLPNLGPYDFAPLVALLVVWIGRELARGVV